VTLVSLAREAGPPLSALAAAFAFDRALGRRGLRPPGFADPVRRAGAGALLALCFWFGIFFPLGSLGLDQTPDLAHVPTWQLFALHALFVSTLLGWYLLGFAGTGARLAEQVGLATARPGREVAIGILAGFAAWVVVIVVVVSVALVIAALGGEKALPQQPPALIPWLAGRPFALRAALAASAGLVEESFFRGFLQPRVGILAATALFALPHLTYNEPFLLVGITALSILYGLLTWWRQSIVAAVVAHAIFDGVQLLVVIPLVLRYFYPVAG